MIKIIQIFEDKAIVDTGAGPVTMAYSPVEYQNLSPQHAFILGMAYATFLNRGIPVETGEVRTKADIAQSKTEVI